VRRPPPYAFDTRERRDGLLVGKLVQAIHRQVSRMDSLRQITEVADFLARESGRTQLIVGRGEQSEGRRLAIEERDNAAVNRGGGATR